MAEPDWIDAEFKVVKPPRQKRRWRIWVDWRNALWLTVPVVIGLLKAWVDGFPRP